jgi:alkanesulfonate monooxygenase SsuD/methylene tetrahydromethanopterin reductase-like flavin-dependent oxidoreductase (luciferase family)
MEKSMASVQFGWALNAETTQGMAPPHYTQLVQRQLELVGPHVDSLWFVDHVQFGDSPLLEGWTALTFLCAQYPQFHVGHMVLCQSFRNPALLAKMAATLQFLSNGRFTFSIGAGWHEEEYLAYGYEFPPAGARVDQLAETLEIVKALWTEKRVTYQGRYFSVNAAYCEPRPDPVPPILIGGKGARMLNLVARYADGWNAAWIGPEEYRQRDDVLKQECGKVGRDPAEIQRSWFGRCVCVASKKEAVTLEGRGLLGTPEQIVEKLQAYVELGIHYFMLGSKSLSDMTTVELLAKEVLPNIKS